MAYDLVFDALDRNHQRDLDQLFTLLRQPSISAQDIGIRECAELERSLLQAAGLSTRLLETRRHPMVYGERLAAPGKPTLLLYGHYDVQPPEPLERWETPPFEPVIRDGLILGRGAGDNKGQHYANICGIRAWIEATGDLPINVKVLLEGEEETGSPHLEDVVAANRALLAADLVFTADGPVQNDDFPQIDYGVRGVLSIEIRVNGASHDLHSGNWGGVAPNAAWLLVHLLGTMMDAENRVTVEGFSDDVAPLSDIARLAIGRMPLDEEAALAAVGIERLPPPDDRGYFERLAAQPTMTINGLTSGYQGAGSKTVIPAVATAKLDMRLVPNQRCDDIYQKVVNHIHQHLPDAEVVRQGSMEPSSTPLDHPLAGVVRAAVTAGFGTEPVDVPLLGGSLPDYVWTHILGIPSFVVPYAQADERNHAPNERFAVERFQNGARTMAALIGELAAIDSAAAVRADPNETILRNLDYGHKWTLDPGHIVEIYQVCLLHPGTTALEVGSFRGHCALALALAGFAVTSIDVSDKHMGERQALIERHGQRVDFRIESSDTQLENSDTYDVVLHDNSRRGDALVAELTAYWQRKVNPGGLLIVHNVEQISQERLVEALAPEGQIVTKDPRGRQLGFFMKAAADRA